MDQDAVLRYISTTFADVQVAESNGSFFIFHGPEGKVPERGFPFATLVTTDEYDQVSDLSRPGIFRLNIGVSRLTFKTLFKEGAQTYNFAALDKIMPHPIYGMMNWLCVLNPGEATWDTSKAYLAEAYGRAVAKEP